MDDDLRPDDPRPDDPRPDDLRLAIDRLVRNGGRLTIHAAGGDTSVVLEQRGSRFGILEVTARILVTTGARDAADRAAEVGAMGWSDPTVTYRNGREIRLQRGEASADAPTTLMRTWRVPPALAAEIADAVHSAIREVGRLDFVPLATRDWRAIEPARTPWPPTEERGLDQPDERRMMSRTVPAPLKGLLGVAIAGAVTILWAGMIRDASRSLDVAAGATTSAIAAGASAGASAAVSPAPSPPTPIPGTSASVAPVTPHRVPVANASTQEDSGPAAAAIDGDPVTAWHAAFGVPQWIEIGLDSPTTVNEVVLLIAQSEDGPTRHMIQVAVTGQPFHLVAVIDRETGDGDKLGFRPEPPIANVERIRIETIASPSNAGWYEVIVR